MTKVIAITGASSGIGKSLANIFSKNGYSLLLLARNIAALEALNLPNCLCRQVDVTSLSQIQSAVDEAEKKLGTIDCWINNAGVALFGSFSAQENTEKNNIINVNVQGVINGIDAVLPLMQKRRQGTIINISSVADRKSRPNLAVYAASKSAVASLTESLRAENANNNIRFCNVAPAKINTGMLTRAGVQSTDTIQPEAFAKTVLWIYEQPQEVCIRDMVFAPTAYEA